ncbi:hypothetical protein ACJIZ3_022665 [Penstemon smallii]|uniref:Uncharacterized protein n=1 Tax=Penstemon smallii TaxID=265156 RepID=A0ABD3TLV9_9LAMI
MYHPTLTILSDERDHPYMKACTQSLSTSSRAALNKSGRPLSPSQDRVLLLSYKRGKKYHEPPGATEVSDCERRSTEWSSSSRQSSYFYLFYIYIPDKRIHIKIGDLRRNI